MLADPEVEALLGPVVGSPGPAATPPRTVSPVRGGDMAMVGAYDGAQRFESTLALWQPEIRSADDEILTDKSTLDSRARDVLRNDSYVAGGATLHKDNIVGSMFLLNAKPNLAVLGLDEKWEEEFQAEVEAKFALWAESLDYWPDAARMGTLTDLVRLAVGVFLAGGEVLASVEWLKEPGRLFSTAIQMVDTDRLSDPPNVNLLGPQIRGGVERDRYGAPVAYHIRTTHPNDWMGGMSRFLGPFELYKWKRVAARKPWGRRQVIHIIEQMRPDQTRGFSEMTSALKELRITKRFRDTVLQNATVNATYAATIESEMPTAEIFARLDGVDNIEAAVADYAAGYMGAINQYAGAAKNLAIDGVRIPHLMPGTKLNLQPAGNGGPLGSDFEASLLRYIAASLGVSYEELSRDYTQTNYSSARAAMNNTWKFMQSRKRKVADTFATMIFRLWFEEAANKGQIEALKSKKIPPIYTDGVLNQTFDALTQCDWIGASRGQIDELKETQAAIMRLKFGLTTRERELGRMGEDWRKVNSQLQREKADEERRGLVFADTASATVSGASDQQNADTRGGDKKNA